ncbi:sigma-70 family RNA polymerase sigma factor [Actinosynnema sp. CS-041913]|uniref:sigma-70 family RNA polymerase sigma factor n=1 Tax=Actinosynnema sp. CS-041913 TaxID=3239917 RepID=UPI003D8F1C4D
MQGELAMPDDTQFARDTERYRRELLAHCYRMLGSVQDAEDLVQETYLRAWRAYGNFEGRSSVRAWLYRIATNACLTALQHHSRRVLPSGLVGPSGDPYREPVPAGPEVQWLQPIPDALVTSEEDDPATVVATRDSIRLALVASLQYLPSRQRAVLLLREVLAFPAAEVAEMLDTSTAAVKSALRRARVRLDSVDPERRASEPMEREARELLQRYVKAFETSDAAALEELLRADATLEMPPSSTWFSGKATCAPFIATYAVGDPGDWRVVPVAVNGGPGAVSYLRGQDGVYRAYAVIVLDLAVDGIAGITLFGDPGVVSRFGPPVLVEPGRERTASEPARPAHRR